LRSYPEPSAADRALFFDHAEEPGAYFKQEYGGKLRGGLTAWQDRETRCFVQDEIAALEAELSALLDWAKGSLTRFALSWCAVGSR
jgi:hypothetical protein